MGVVTEKLADEKGLVWPASIAPFSLHLLSLSKDKASEAYTLAESLYTTLTTRRGGYNFRGYANFLCKEWNQHHTIDQRLQSLDIYLASQEFSSHFSEAQYKIPLLKDFICPQ
jgi:hypothetical protein